LRIQALPPAAFIRLLRAGASSFRVIEQRQGDHFMSEDHDAAEDIEVLLDNWKPSPLLQHATLPLNVSDPFLLDRLIADSTAKADVEREPFVAGSKKTMSPDEAKSRRFEFFVAGQAMWSQDVRTRMLDEGISKTSVDTYRRAFACSWVDGSDRRQTSSAILAIKASVRDHDLHFHKGAPEKFVIRPIPDEQKALFTPEEMKLVFEINSNLLETVAQDYLEELNTTDLIDASGPTSINEIVVRRGVRMPMAPKHRMELYHLSSYSLALGPAEQFSVMWKAANDKSGIPSIFSAPLPAVQTRVVAFAPFVDGMALDQLELIVAPPVEATPLSDDGLYGAIREYSFQ